MQYSNYEDSYDPNDVPADQAAPLTAYKLPTYSSVNNALSAYGEKDADVKPAAGGVRNGGGNARFTVAPGPAVSTVAAPAAATEAAPASGPAANPILTTIAALDLDLRRVEFTTGIDSDTGTFIPSYQYCHPIS